VQASDGTLSGSNTITVNLTDVDDTPPAAPVALTPANGSSTSDNTPTYSGTAETGSTVTVIVDGTSIGTTTADGSGNWALTQPTALADGSHTVRATATDAANNSSASSNTNSFTVDTTPPAAPVALTPANGSRTSDNTPTYSGTADASVSISVIVDGSAIGTTSSDASGNWTLTQPTALAEGSHTVRATAADGLGNSSASSNTNTFTVDTTPPAAPVALAPANGSSTNDNTPAYSGTAEASSTVTVIVDGSSVGTTTANASGNWALTQPTALADASHTVRATATDAANNTSASSNTNTFTVDTVVPSVSISSTASNPTSTSPIPMTVTFSESVTGFTAGDLIVGNGTASGFAGSGTTYTFNVTPAGDGLVTVDVPTSAAFDAAGNGNSAAATPQFSITYSGPATVVSIVRANGTPSNLAFLTYVVTFDKAVAGLTQANFTLVTTGLSGAAVTGVSNTSASTYNVTVSTGAGDGTLQLRLGNGAGLTPPVSNLPFDGEVYTIDKTVPTLSISSTASNPTSTSPIPMTATFSESVTGFTAADVVITNGTLSNFSGSGATYTFDVTPTTGGTVAANVGANSAQDAAGNGNTATAFALTYVVPVTATTWTGSVSTDWFTAGNWDNGVPSATVDALIPAGQPRYPVYTTGAGLVKDLTVAAGASLTQSGSTIAINGTLSNSGTMSLSGGTVSFTGASQQSIAGSSTTRFWNLVVGANGVSLGQAASVQRLVTLNGDLTTNGQVFTLESTPTLSSMVLNSGGVVLGLATVQRAIDPTLNSGVGYHHYSSPVLSTTVGDLVTAGFTPALNTAYNTSATPTSVTPFPTVFGYEQSRLATTTNNLDLFSKGWFSPASTSDALVTGRGYTVNIGASQKVDFVGALRNTDLSLNLARNSGATATEAGWQLVGNPFPAPMDWSLVSPADRANLDGSMYVYQSTSRYGGQYRAYVNGVGNPFIGVAQGFWVRVSQGQTAANLTLRNSQRLTAFPSGATAGANTFQRGLADTRPLVQLQLQGASGPADAAYVYFESGATAGIDVAFDAVKLPNTSGLNLSAQAGSQELAINGLPMPGTASVTVPLQVAVPVTGSYTLRAAELLNLAGTHAYLRDRQTGALVDLNQQPSYRFTMNVAYSGGRFELLFSPQAVLATAPASLSAQVAVYPNPASKSVFVELPATLGRKAVTVALVDALGRQVLAQTLLAAGAQAHQLPLLNVATGVYSLRISTEQGIVTKKLVVE
jgi:hypothetical protein